MLLSLDFSSNIPIYQQIRNQIIIAISEGILVPGEQLPTIRTLADQTGINMMTVNKAYQLLKQEGYITADRRSGAKVAKRSQEAGVVPASLCNELRLLISQFKLQGINEDQFFSLCRELYQKED
ncbi:GntR family transcriptional regulator [Anaerosporobacter faecicola]|uniref:GntR family transcriptional regulator n=1 Tax=Anaerosporobacter faecicola TaxID=2718714 RepID=UPI00143A57EF|nr:GntR family transcriptional regulator [Anaerosporobacter faecicola]